MDKVRKILDFWFEGINDHTLINRNIAPFKKWFAKNLPFDQEVKTQFQEDLTAAALGKYKSWEASVQGCLALILLFDQFSRNLYRDTPEAFAYDYLALALAKRMVEEGQDKKLPLIYRIFVYMPFMHAEDVKIQELSLRFFEDLVAESKKKIPLHTPYFEYSLSYAQRHYDIIKQFHRFPHRNGILNRIPTEQEMAFLKNKMTSF